MPVGANPDVLVVGAGPTGLMLANQLARHGVRPLLIDRNPGPSLQTKALGVHARTLEIYAHLGLADRAVDLGVRATGANIWVRGKRAVRVPLGDIGRDLSPYPFLLILGQDENERLLGEALRAHGIAVEWSTTLVGLEQNGKRVTARLQRPDGSTQHVTARWIAGCDGARSTVRSLCNIDFVGAPYEHVFYVADTHATGPMVPGEINVYLWRNGFHLMFPMRGDGHWRVAGILPPELRAREDVDLDAVLPSFKQEAGDLLSFQSCTWFSTYRIHHRRAARFRDRRCFLLGDAAHIHSPVGAQGMNTGLQDAYNLAWKLGLVVTGRAGEALLDAYEAERVPVADRLLHTTDRMFAIVLAYRGLAGVLRNRVLPRALAFAMTRARARLIAFRTISQIGIRYPQSPLSQTLPGLAGNGPRAGDRFPWLQLELSPGGASPDIFANLDDTRFNLILIGQALPADFPADLHERLRIHRVADTAANDAGLGRARIPKPSFYVLRPDGHVGLAGARIETADVSRYFHERVQQAVAGFP